MIDTILIWGLAIFISTVISSLNNDHVFVFWQVRIPLRLFIIRRFHILAFTSFYCINKTIYGERLYIQTYFHVSLCCFLCQCIPLINPFEYFKQQYCWSIQKLYKFISILTWSKIIVSYTKLSRLNWHARKTADGNAISFLFFFEGHSIEGLSLKSCKPYSTPYFGQFMIIMYAIHLHGQFMTFMPIHHHIWRCIDFPVFLSTRVRYR